jgi:hypothetical protein
VTTKVLYVEHDDDNLYMLKTRLERCGNFEASPRYGFRIGITRQCVI